MNDYDQLFKKLLKAFFDDLLLIVRPSLAAGASLSQKRVEEQELFSDLKQGEKRFADLVVKLFLADANLTQVFIHVEVESEAGEDMGSRMWYYNLQLQLREHLAVFPIVLYLTGGEKGIKWKTHRVSVLEDVICEFKYLSVGLSRMDAEEYLARPEPLAWALAAYMKSRRGRAWLKLSCLKRIARARLDDVRTFLLLEAVQTRLELRAHEEEAYERLLEAEQPEEVREMEMTWSGRLLQKGRQEGRQEGRRELLRQQLRVRFDTFSEASSRRLDAITSPEELDDLAVRLLSAKSLEELRLA